MGDAIVQTLVLSRVTPTIGNNVDCRRFGIQDLIDHNVTEICFVVILASTQFGVILDVIACGALMALQAILRIYRIIAKIRHTETTRIAGAASSKKSIHF